MLFTFHIDDGEKSRSVRNFLGKDFDEITFQFFKVDEVRSVVASLHFEVVDVLVRHPYPDVEFPSKRAYFVLRKPREDSPA